MTKAILARDIMIRDPQTAPPTMNVWAALSLMRSQDIRHLPVTDNGKVLGIVSNRDFRRIFEWIDADDRIRGVRTAAVKEIMTGSRELVTAHPDTPVLNIAQLMVRKRVGSVPVIDGDGHLIGMITQKDVMQALTHLLLESAR